MSGLLVIAVLAAASEPAVSWRGESSVFKDRSKLALDVGTTVSTVVLDGRFVDSRNETLERDERQRELTASLTRRIGLAHMSLTLVGSRLGDSAPGHSHRIDRLKLSGSLLRLRHGDFGVVPRWWWVREKTTVQRGPGDSDTNHGGGGSVGVEWPGVAGDLSGRIEAEAREETGRRLWFAGYAAQETLGVWRGALRAHAQVETDRYPLGGGGDERRETRQAACTLDSGRDLGSGWRVDAHAVLSGHDATYQVRPEGGYRKSTATWRVVLGRGTEREAYGALALEQTAERESYERPLNDRRHESRNADFEFGMRRGDFLLQGSGRLSLNQQFFTHPSNPDDRDQATQTFKLDVTSPLPSGFVGNLGMRYRDTRLVYPEAERAASSTRRRLYELEPGISWSGPKQILLRSSLALRADYNLFRFRDEYSTLARGTVAKVSMETPLKGSSSLTVDIRGSREDEGGYRQGSYGRGGETEEVEVAARMSGWRVGGVETESTLGVRRRWSDGWGLRSFKEGSAGVRLSRSPAALELGYVWRNPGADYLRASAGVGGIL